MLRALSTTAHQQISACARVPHRALVAVSGANAGQLLNGILSATVSPNFPRYTAILHAQGRIQFDIFLWPLDSETFLIEHDPRQSEAPPLTSLLKRYILRSKVKVSDVSDQYDVWQAWGDNQVEPIRKWKHGNKGAVEPVWELDAWKGSNTMSLRDLRAVGMGTRHLVRQGEKIALKHEVVSEDHYTSHRLRCGVPEGVVDLPPLQALAMNSNLDLMGAIDFRKGCYVGQELTVRTYHTGVVRRRIFPVTLQPLEGERKEHGSSGFTPSLDPQDLVVSSTESAQPQRRRGTPNRLLTNLNGVGLASIKTQQIPHLTNGQLDMIAVDNSGVQYVVKPQVPSWWPIQEFEDE